MSSSDTSGVSYINHRRRQDRYRGYTDGGALFDICYGFVGAYECTESMVNALFCSYLSQIILLCCMVSFGNMWAISKMGKDTAIVAEARSDSPTSFTFGPYGYCVIGNSSTIPTRCFNPNEAEEYTKKHIAVQKIQRIHMCWVPCGCHPMLELLHDCVKLTI